jgi:hypothetical protein
MVEHLRIDKFATNKSVNFEHYRWLNFMSPDGRFIRNGELFFFSIGICSGKPEIFIIIFWINSFWLYNLYVRWW